MYPNIWLSRAAYDNLISDMPDPYQVALLLHEQEHVKRIGEAGAINWMVKYALSPSFRFYEELKAMRPQFSYLKAEGLSLDLDKRARVLSGWLYFWPVSFSAAKQRVEELWNES